MDESVPTAFALNPPNIYLFILPTGKLPETANTAAKIDPRRNITLPVFRNICVRVQFAVTN